MGREYSFLARCPCLFAAGREPPVEMAKASGCERAAGAGRAGAAGAGKPGTARRQSIVSSVSHGSHVISSAWRAAPAAPVRLPPPCHSIDTLEVQAQYKDLSGSFHGPFKLLSSWLPARLQAISSPFRTPSTTLSRPFPASLKLVQRPFPEPFRAFSPTPAGVLPAPAPRQTSTARPHSVRRNRHSGPQVSELNIHTSGGLSSRDLTRKRALTQRIALPITSHQSPVTSHFDCVFAPSRELPRPCGCNDQLPIFNAQFSIGPCRFPSSILHPLWLRLCRTAPPR